MGEIGLGILLWAAEQRSERMLCSWTATADAFAVGLIQEPGSLDELPMQTQPFASLGLKRLVAAELNGVS